MNIKNYDIYLSRTTSALCLFLILSEANVWLNPINNTLLVLGYRLFIIFTPLFFIVFKHRLSFIAFILAELGITAWIYNYLLTGTLLFSIGIAISGYMLKYYSSFTTKGAAGNKIALNIGSIFSGLIVAMFHNIKFILIFCLIITATSFFSFFKYYCRENLSQLTTEKSHFKFNKIFSPMGIAWASIGFVIGVKLIAIVSILPQFIMQNNAGHLPAWFGGMLIFNSLFVVLFQIPIMNTVKKFNKIQSLLPLILAMIVISFSYAFGVSSLYGALVWTLCLSIVECAVSFLDKLSQDDGFLLIKEISVGLGSAATVLCIRTFSPQTGSTIIGSVSLLLLGISILIFHCN